MCYLKNKPWELQQQNVFVMSLLHVVHKDFVGVVHGWVLKFLETEQ